MLAKHIPNAITISRVISTFLMVFYYYFKAPFYQEVLFFVFTISSISDFFDGYLSRKWNVVSNLGTCLDPISDKLLTITCLVLLIDAKGVNLIFAFIIVMREIIISGLREFLSLSKIELPVSRVAKWKTAFQLIGIGTCFFAQSKHFPIWTEAYIKFPPFNFLVKNVDALAQITMTLAVITTLYTGILYIINSAKYLK